MKQGYIKITENEKDDPIFEIKLTDRGLWMAKHEIADLFKTNICLVANNFYAIFKAGLLREEDVTRIHKYENNGRQCEVTLYNLEAIIYISYRVPSFRARAFRNWATNTLLESTRDTFLQKVFIAQGFTLSLN